MHKDYFIDAYYYLIIIAYFVNLFRIYKVILYVTKVYRLIELVVASVVLEATMEGMEKLSVLRVEQCDDRWPTGKWGPQVCIWYENKVRTISMEFDMRIEVIRY
jgi:hypothetical protein